MLRKTTAVYADHGVPLECDIYAADDYPRDAPVFLYFHPGGLVSGSRDCVTPWLVQVCYQRKWPLVSPSYRLLPQTVSGGLLEDVSAAYEFALRWDAEDGGTRGVVVGGASGGFFAAALIAHRLGPPLALFSLMGINTFHHPFFLSSTQLTPEPIRDEDMAEIIAAPVAVGASPPWNPGLFDLEKLLPDGSKNPEFRHPPPPSSQPGSGKYTRGELYDYYVYMNAFPDLVGELDPGYGWARDPANKARLNRWPPTVILHGSKDFDVPLGVSDEMRAALGDDKVRIAVAEGQPHLFEAG